MRKYRTNGRFYIRTIPQTWPKQKYIGRMDASLQAITDPDLTHTVIHKINHWKICVPMSQMIAALELQTFRKGKKWTFSPFNIDVKKRTINDFNVGNNMEIIELVV